VIVVAVGSMKRPHVVAVPGQFLLVARFAKLPAMLVAVPPNEMSTSLQKMFEVLKLEGNATVSVLVALVAVVTRLLLMMKAIVWLEVADGCELDSVSERALT
jgi:hypothetical protein